VPVSAVLAALGLLFGGYLLYKLSQRRKKPAKPGG